MKSFDFTPCKWDEIKPQVAEYIKTNGITIESYWEDQVMASNFYRITCGGETAGFFAVHGGSTLVLFSVSAAFANRSLEVFHEVRRYEQVTSGLVLTGDEFFLSHCFDNHNYIEKLAFVFSYTEKNFPAERRKSLQYRAFEMERDVELLKDSGLFPDDEMNKVYNKAAHMEVLIAELDGAEVGFGVIDYGRVVEDIASIGMFVHEEFRRQGIAANILHDLKLTVQSKSYRAFSGCWYYNHNSKKSIESAGGFSKSRMLKFFF
ncbi:MAG: hypothetical protein FWH20_05505 [Oscillospiraceae bacterium]|nr:hypothetical protein [Oscillospiraceae bacterium]